MECSKVHDLYLEKYSEETPVIYQDRECQLVDIEGCKEDDNGSLNKELELFLPEFYQKTGVNTPLVIRKEFLISKYSHKSFTSSIGLDTLLPDSKIGILWKKGKSKGTPWHPCYVRVDKHSRTLEYFSHKSNRLLPKATIPLEDINLFVEPMYRLTEPLTNDGEFYLHIIWTKHAPNTFTKMSLLKKKNSVIEIRNLYFRPSTDFDLFQWYFSILAGKHEIVSLTPTRNNNTLKRCYTFDTRPDIIGEREQFGPIVSRKRLTDIISDENEFIPQNRKSDLYDLAIDPLVCSPNPLVSPPDPREVKTLPDRLRMAMTGSYCMDTRGDNSYVESAVPSNLIAPDEEVEGDFKTNVTDFELSGKFYSCHSAGTTNPFLEPPAPSLDNIFQSKLDICPIIDPQGAGIDKDSWINCSVNYANYPSIDSCPLDLSDTEVDQFTLTPLCDTLRLDIQSNKKYYQMSGWLHKVGDMQGDKWRSRWFTLSNTLVTYSDTNLSPFPKNYFYLGSDFKGYYVDTNYPRFHLMPPPTRFVFRIVTPSRIYHICAQTEEIRKIWVEIISRVIALSFVLKL
ncbi:hypothetical protein LOD99_2846 [Oopsacas minuta]|uniref:PH domain-containing protein n=1 Tax=Oopsacas minuta TaxID=111878 RepID=A0AAV7K200_9METZ|nr:hypothetical protein LOD99_2846 [Oopsacas minuta]